MNKNNYIFISKLAEVEQLLKPFNIIENDVVVLVDENTLKYCWPLLINENPSLSKAEIIEIESGEQNKNISICYQIWETLSQFNANRNTLFINLGGGVICDLGGFIASTYKRGIPFINIPTTLLAQVDASIGGKTGVDLNQQKNMVGTFSQAQNTIIFPGFLSTLPQNQLTSGFAEMLKHALISDKNYWEELIQIDAKKLARKEIEHSVKIKSEIVEADTFEKGERKTLNFGHTIGHAVESYSLENPDYSLLHGEAVAIGMICESYLSNQFNTLSNKEFEIIEKNILKHFPKYNHLETIHFHRLIELMKNDKKNSSNKINFTLLNKIGEASFNHEIEIEQIITSLEYYIALQ